MSGLAGQRHRPSRKGHTWVGYSDAINLGIPETTIRSYSLCSDMVLLDKRRVRRHIRRARHEPCCEALKDWWRRRLNSMDRHL